MVRQISSRRGASLVEVLIAMLIMILGFLSLHRLQVVTIRNNKYAAELTRAVQLAADRMEHLTGGSCADPPSGSITRGFFVVTW